MLKRTGSTYIHSFLLVWFRTFRQSLGDIRWDRLKYMLIFSLAPMFANMQKAWFSPDAVLFGLDLMSWMGIAYCLGAGWLFLSVSFERIVPVARRLAVLAVCTFILWRLLPGPAGFVSAVLFSFFYGGIAAMQVFFFAYALNDSERFFGVVSVAVYGLIFQFGHSLPVIGSVFSTLYLGSLLLGAVVCLFFADKKDYEKPSEEREPGAAVALTLMLFFFFAHKVIEVFYTYIDDASSFSALRMNAIVGIVILLISLVLFFRFKSNVWHMCNLFFVGLSLTYVFHLIGNTSLAHVFHGFEQIGFVSSYVLLGGVLQQVASFRSFKKILFVTMNAALFIYLIPGLIKVIKPASQLIIGASITFSLSLIFFFLAPFYARRLFETPHRQTKTSATEATNGQADDAPSLQAQANRWMEDMHLTAREQEVVMYLLNGYLYKQCAAELNISIDTVKFHIGNAYRKLGISGRGELFKTFFNGELTPDSPPKENPSLSD